MHDVGGFMPDIRARDRPGDDDVSEVAARQHGVVAHRQLIELGLGKKAIQHRVSAGRLHRIYVGVYAVGHPLITPHGRWMAAVLACGPGAMLSHRSAAALWQLRASARSEVDVTARRNRVGSAGITFHRARRLHPADRTKRHGIPVTTVARTLLDLAEVLLARELDRAFEEAERLGVLDLRAIDELQARARGRRGLRPLTAVVARSEPPAATRSELERHFLDLCRDAGLPVPAVNVHVAGFEVDLLWSGQRLVVEVDGHAFHRTRAAFERDRIKDAALQLAGYRVLRVTHRRLENEPAVVAESMRQMLASA